ncbi:MAG: hypothetical protein A2087_09390 [Spirochaetes bacterium GWD1_61_31]|nr:MAG: hypothetical protein A2Y37_01415 [Spirochaetes bacterium GWB1_60_80]OHD30697.1 MAG: hypothetical protein A2004_11505 [Spirochaetes bacterium GWC1_61_12]OHD41264.1 MAG: hypothetical protein A2087_09390 [Spirochaetes bacterium GWD1_61_31]OHD45189.1 MAG: hypothetical protein A2Y35_10490 [Spirochaetes bacterium GWE1_60_18]OHD60163.1 MAG: hypothetical protein A2Y32_01755 [Spirochaetes bacterium GWF1_60_12]
MDAAQTQILEKVKKLLALASSPSEAEAAAALDKATVLLAKHGLSLAEVQEEAEVQESVLLEKQRLRGWESALIYGICQATFTEALHYRSQAGGRILLIGREVNIVTARELFGYLHRLILVLGRAHSPSLAHVESFRQGIVHRIGERLAARNAADSAAGRTTRADPATTALILRADAAARTENQAFIKQKYGSTSTRKSGRRVEADSYHRGRAVADSISLDQQID